MSGGYSSSGFWCYVLKFQRSGVGNFPKGHTHMVVMLSIAAQRRISVSQLFSVVAEDVLMKLPDVTAAV